MRVLQKEVPFGLNRSRSRRAPGTSSITWVPVAPGSPESEEAAEDRSGNRSRASRGRPRDGPPTKSSCSGAASRRGLKRRGPVRRNSFHTSPRTLTDCPGCDSVQREAETEFRERIRAIPGGGGNGGVRARIPVPPWGTPSKALLLKGLRARQWFHGRSQRPTGPPAPAEWHRRRGGVIEGSTWPGQSVMSPRSAQGFGGAVRLWWGAAVARKGESHRASPFLPPSYGGPSAGYLYVLYCPAW